MICSVCGGYVEWKGELTNLAHTECSYCHAINSQLPDDIPFPGMDETEERELAREYYGDDD